MRQALSLKPVNANSSHTTNKSTFKNHPQFGAKLTRQIGTSDLRRDVLSITTKNNDSPLIKTDIKENFEVFEDPEPTDELVTKEDKNDKNDNNMIHELERKMEEKSRGKEQKKIDNEDRKKFLLPRSNVEFLSMCSEPPSEAHSIIGTCDDDDFDKVSVASSTYTTIRASISSIHFDAVVKEKEKQDEKEKERKEKEEKHENMLTSEEYFADIFKYMRNRQMTTRPSHRYMEKQSEVNQEMRTILIDWFHDVVIEYRLQKETFHLAVSIVDRVMSSLSVDKIQFQLVGTTSLMIAAKYEEIFPPETDEFAIITDNTYRISDILKMERYLLGSLKFAVSSPTSAWFGTCFAKRMRFTSKMLRSINYLLDLSLLDIGFLRYEPSTIAAAAACFTNIQSGLEAWPQKIQDDTGITKEDFSKCLKDLHRLYICASSNENKSIFSKYSDADQEEVALLPAPSDKLRELFPEVFGGSPRVPK